MSLPGLGLYVYGQRTPEVLGPPGSDGLDVVPLGWDGRAQPGVFEIEAVGVVGAAGVGGRGRELGGQALLLVVAWAGVSRLQLTEPQGLLAGRNRPESSPRQQAQARRLDQSSSQ